jgi:hypothetical protein
MPVVINEFEAVAEMPARPTAAEQGDDRDQTPTKIEAHDIARALHALAHQALRSWPH